MQIQLCLPGQIKRHTNSSQKKTKREKSDALRTVSSLFLSLELQRHSHFLFYLLFQRRQVAPEKVMSKKTEGSYLLDFCPNGRTDGKAALGCCFFGFFYLALGSKVVHFAGVCAGSIEQPRQPFPPEKKIIPFLSPSPSL